MLRKTLVVFSISLLTIGMFVSSVSAAHVDSVQIRLNNADMSLTQMTSGNRDGSAVADLNTFFSFNDIDWTQWNMSTAQIGSPVFNPNELTNNAGDILWLGAAGNTDTPFVSAGNVTQVSPTEILVEWDDVSVGQYAFTDIVTTYSVTEGAPGTINAVPIPGAVWLLGTGLVGLAGLRRRTSA